jgi:PTS hybrid protein
VSTHKVGLVIVSHSAEVARGTAEMARQMGGDVTIVDAGGDAEGGLGSDVAKIMAAIEKAWSPAGVAILCDLGGAETNSEMAIEMRGGDPGAGIVVLKAPLVEGAVVAAAVAATGASLEEVRAAAEEMAS